MENMHEVLHELERTKERSVLATIVQVEGSAYRKEGATMLFTETGKHIGIISAGCLEIDLAIHAKKLLHDRTRSCKKLTYDMSTEDDLSWGRGAGCNGVIHILLEKVTDEMRKNLLTLREYLDQGCPVMSIRLLNDFSLLQPFFITKSGKSFGWYVNKYDSIIKSIRPGKKSRTLFIENRNEHVYVQYYFPKPRLFIFGGGPDVIPLASIADQSGFDITIWDWRQTNLEKLFFPNAQLINEHSTTKTIANIQFTRTDSVVIMTHDFQKDKELIHLLLQEQLGYLGILGPRNRTIRLLDGEPIPDQVHSPVGLPIGGQGPAEIAISIIAELIQTQRKVINKEWVSQITMEKFA